MILIIKVRQGSIHQVAKKKIHLLLLWFWLKKIYRFLKNNYSMNIAKILMLTAK